MSKFSFEEMGAVTVSFAADTGMKGGQVVKVTEDGTVGPCADGDAFCGVALEPRNGAAAVQVKGFYKSVPHWAAEPGLGGAGGGRAGRRKGGRSPLGDCGKRSGHTALPRRGQGPGGQHGRGRHCCPLPVDLERSV